MTVQVALQGRLGDFSLDVSFSAPDRGVVALFGPSGCGKTSVLRGVAGLHACRGRVQVGDAVWQDDDAGLSLPAHARGVGYVFQEANLFSHLTVMDNLLFGHRRAPSADVGPSPDSVIDLLGLSHLVNRQTFDLSGGERQRVAMGRALLSRPRILLLDEPLAALDRRSKDEILPYLERLIEAQDIPVIYVSHDISEVTRLASTMVLMANGTVRAEGSTTDMLQRLDLGPALGRFEAGVAIDARVVGFDQRFCLTELSIGPHVITTPMMDANIGDVVGLRIRARDVALATQPPGPSSMRNVLDGVVIDISEEPETAFAETLIDIGPARLRARVTRKSVHDLGLKIGTSVFAMIKSVSFDGRAVGQRTQGHPQPIDKT